MADSPMPTVVISDGGPAALLTMWSEGVIRPGPGSPSPAGLSVWRPASLSPVAWAAVDHAAQLCRFSNVIDGSVGEDGATPGDGLSGPAISRMLLAAAEEAVRGGVSRIIWPIHLGGTGGAGSLGDVDQIAAAFDRALLVSRLAGLDAGPEGLTIETPYLDMSDEQIADLIADCDAPVEAAWWCQAAESNPGRKVCGGCVPCRRWAAAFRAAGVAVGLGRVGGVEAR